ncbi:MAG: cation:proton antiporter subunit C [archaeon]
MINLPFIAVAVLLLLGFYTLMFKRNLIKIVIGINIIGAAVNLFLIALGYVKDSGAPIYTLSPTLNMVAPIPQALTLTSIVIDLAVTAMMLSFVIMIYKKYQSIEAEKVQELNG